MKFNKTWNEITERCAFWDCKTALAIINLLTLISSNLLYIICYTQITFWRNSELNITAYFLAGAANEHPSDDESWHSQGHSCDTAEILNKQRYKHHADTSTGIQDTTDKADFGTASIQDVSKNFPSARIPSECDTESETTERG